ncbi:MAG: 50S ribosomal protein L11 methyltransferase [Candidatus Aenigmarchaeota archaeon]|nr:50S ribosomal protein L11 methyltransferase [Candidatus Aenigmarchaeota archaeon]
MKKKELEIILSKFKLPEKFEVSFEQYPLTPEIAADVLFLAYVSKDIENKIIADFGCGNGILGLGAALLGAKKVFLIDIDEKMIETAKENFSMMSKSLKSKVLFLNEDILNFDEEVDVVLQNPPFGSKKKHYDIIFLEKALEIAKKIYSIHRYDEESLEFLRKFVEERSGKVMLTKVYEYKLKKIYKFHKKPVKIFKIVLLKIVRP